MRKWIEGHFNPPLRWRDVLANQGRIRMDNGMIAAHIGENIMRYCEANLWCEFG